MSYGIYKGNQLDMFCVEDRIPDISHARIALKLSDLGTEKYLEVIPSPERLSCQQGTGVK